MSTFKEISELKIGSITEVSGSSIRIELSKDISELKRIYKGRVYPIGQFASVIKIHYGRRVLVAYVRRLRMRSDIMLEENEEIPPNFEDSRIIEANLFGEGIWDPSNSEFRFSRGVSNYPLPGQAAYLTTQQELSKIYSGSEAKFYNDFSNAIEIGTYIGSGGTKCYANFDKLFGLHSAVLGSTGAGKSGTVAALIHSVLNHQQENGNENLKPSIVIIDPHGEYAKAFRGDAIIYRAYEEQDQQEQEDIKQLKLPFWTLSGEEFRDLVIGKTEYEATSENNIVYKALEHSKLVQKGFIEKATDWRGREVEEEGFKPDDPRPVDDEYEPLIASYNRDTPEPFSLDEFENHIKFEQAIKPKYGNWEKHSPSDYKPFGSVLDKLSVLRNDPRLKFLMDDYQEDNLDLHEVLYQFLGPIDIGEEDPANLKIVDISGLPNEVAGPLTASISRLLFQYKVWQSRSERENDPILLVCEEAHRYVPDTGMAEYKTAQTAIRRLAKEGRKYGIGLMLVSQRPSDVESTVLSQCNSWIVLRLTNSSDQKHVNRFLPDSLAGLSKLLPSLARQEAIFVGEASAIPARIKIKDLDKDELPKSDDISFIKGWCSPPSELEQIETIVQRWRNETEEEDG